MKFQNQPKGKNIIPSLNKDIISKMNVANLDGTASQNKNDGSKCGFFSTIPTGFMNAGS